MNNIKPMLFNTLKGYTKKQLVSDIIAGIIVAVIALPLSIALALASGVGPKEGLYTAIIAGFLISFFGGSHVQIAGPTAAFATIVAGVVAKNGMEGLVLATVLAGVFLILMGVFRLGSLIRFIPYTITTGFTAGIAVTILIGQLKDFFGLTYSAGTCAVETMEKLSVFFEHISTINLWSVLVGVISIIILIVTPKITSKIPGSLIAVIIGIFVVKLFSLPVNTIGDLYSVSGSLPTFHFPSFNLGLLKTVLPDAFTIAILAAIESLLSCVVADSMAGTKHRSDTELVAQGIGNIGSALFGGIPATGAIARTAANIKNGGKTPIAGIVHAIVLLLILVLLMPYAALIPMPVIAAILFVVAYNMCQWRPFVHLVKTSPVSDIVILILTFILTVVFDLVVAIAVGLILTCVLFMKRMSDETRVRAWSRQTDENSALLKVADDIAVYEIEGPLFFGSTSIISQINASSNIKCLILRMRSVTCIDATAMKSLSEMYDSLSKKGVRVIFSHVNQQPMNVMRKSGFILLAGQGNFCPNIKEALFKAENN